MTVQLVAVDKEITTNDERCCNATSEFMTSYARLKIRTLSQRSDSLRIDIVVNKIYVQLTVC